MGRPALDSGPRKLQAIADMWNQPRSRKTCSQILAQVIPKLRSDY